MPETNNPRQTANPRLDSSEPFSLLLAVASDAHRASQRR
jgi:hypothetical protein